VGRPTNNQLSTSSYDVAGNTIYDAYNTYYYYPEGDLCAVQPNLTGSSLTMYVYDAAGTRVAKGTPVWTGSGSPNMSTLCSAPGGGTGWSFSAEEQYLLDQNNEQVSELTGTSTPTPERTNIWSGTNIATYDFVNGGVHFALTDWLGTKRVQVLGTGTNYGTIDLAFISLPYGNNIGNSRAVESVGSGTDATEHHFTGKERDTESGNDYFSARYLTSSIGRWLVPDWSATAEPVPYAKLGDPQTLNLYTYAYNNPFGAIDPDGHDLDCSGANKSMIGCVVSTATTAFFSGKEMSYDGENLTISDPSKSTSTSTAAQQQGAQTSSHHTKKAQPTGLPKNGEASIYSDWFEGKTTASGETFSQNGYTAALLPKKRWHTVPLRTRVEITHNGRSVVVEVNDRGAGARDESMTRVLDVTRAAASYLTGQTISNDNDSNSVGLISITITQVPNTTPLGPVSQEQK